MLSQIYRENGPHKKRRNMNSGQLLRKDSSAEANAAACEVKYG